MCKNVMQETGENTCKGYIFKSGSQDSMSRGFAPNHQVILNLIQDLQRLLLSFINGMRGRCQIKFGMTALYTPLTWATPFLSPTGEGSFPMRGNCGFTLIELLVVVLIIGILAAVALPQYQKAVIKARVAEYEVNLKALAQANEACYLRKAENCTINELDIEVPECNPIPGLFNSCSYALGKSWYNPFDSSSYAMMSFTSGGSLVYFPYDVKPMGNGYPTLQGLACTINDPTRKLCEKMGFSENVIWSGAGLFYVRP